MSGRITWDDVEGVQKLREIRKAIQGRNLYRHLAKRKFITPKGYRDYADVIMTIALNVELAELGLDLAGHRWIWLCAIDIFSRAAAENIFPVYRVEADLLTLLLEAEEPKLFGSILPAPIESGLFLFPQGMIEVGRWSVDWLLIDTIDQGQRAQVCQFGNESIVFERMGEGDRRRYRWVTQTGSMSEIAPGDMFLSTFGYSETGEELNKHHVSISEDDIDLTRILTALAKHLWLWLYQPKEYEYVEASRSRGFGKKSTETKTPICYPIKLGIEEQPHRIYRPTIAGDRAQTDSQTPRKSPRKHVRRSHWRNVPIGLRSEGKRELRLIQKSVINPGGDI